MPKFRGRKNLSFQAGPDKADKSGTHPAPHVQAVHDPESRTYFIELSDADAEKYEEALKAEGFHREAADAEVQTPQL